MDATGAMLVQAIVLLCCITQGLAVKGKTLPHNFPTCHRFDPKIDQCLLKASEQVKPYLAAGVPELNIPPFEPFLLPQVSLEQGTSALNFKATLNNVKVSGLTNYTFSRMDFDVPNLQFFCECTIGELILKGDYKVTGRVLLAPIEGNGNFTANIDKCDVFFYQKIEVVDKKGVDYLKPLNTSSTIKVANPRVKLQGLFGNNSDLNDVTNRAINENVDVLFEELRPVVEKVLNNIMEDLLFRALMDNIPWDNLYPPIP